MSVEPEVCEEILRFSTNSRYLDGFRLPSGLIPTSSYEEALDGAACVLVVVPSGVFREVAKRLIPLLDGRTPVVLATKGLESGTGLLSIEVWREESRKERGRRGPDPVVMTGPNLAGEIRAGLPAVSVLAGNDAAVRRHCAELLEHELVHLVECPDPLGAQMAGAMKNVYAVGSGIAAGLDWGSNVTAALIWKGLEETGDMVEAAGGDRSVLLTPAGVGDFVATCTSPLSRNHHLGRSIAGRAGATEEPRGVREGAGTAQEALRRARKEGFEPGLLRTVWSVMAGFSSPASILEALWDTPGQERFEECPARSEGSDLLRCGAEARGPA